MVDKTLTLNCGEALTIATASDFHQKVSQALNESSSIELLADSVSKIDTAGMQLVVSLKRELERIGGSLTWNKPSDVVTQSIVTLGLKSHFDIDKNLSK